MAWLQEDMIRGLTGTEDAVDLLGSIATALVAIGDHRIMLAHIVEILEEEATKRGLSVVQATYYAGANYVMQHLAGWHDVLRSAKTEA